MKLASGTMPAEHAAMQHEGASHANSDEHECCPIKPAVNTACDGNCQAVDNLSPKLELPAAPVIATLHTLPLDPVTKRGHGALIGKLAANPFIPRPSLTILFQVFTI